MADESNSGGSLGDAVMKAIGEPEHGQTKPSIEKLRLLRSVIEDNADILLEAIQSISDEIRQCGDLSESFVASLRDEIKTEMALRINRSRSADERKALQFHRDSILHAIPLIAQRLANEAAKPRSN